ncbi:MAG: hypothetical protein ABI689_14910 [Thermoanaerobaculia bacterium]
MSSRSTGSPLEGRPTPPSGVEPDVVVSRRRSFLPALLFLLIFSCAFGALEWREHFYFLQDDNRDHFLPFFARALETLRHGEIGQMDYYQSLGLPLLSNGLSSVLSPLPYVALVVSEQVFGHPFAGIDVLVVFYFLIGGFGFIYLAHQMSLSSGAALFAASAWCLLPFNVYVCASWVSFAPLVAFLPWVVGLLLAGSSRRWLAVATLQAGVLLLFLLAGFIQWFVYAVVFALSLASLLWLRRRRICLVEDGVSPFRALLSGLALVGVIGLPLLLPMWHQTTVSAERAQALSYSTFASEAFRPVAWLNGTLFPFARLSAADPGRTFVEVASPVSLPHTGYVTIGLGLVALIAVARRRVPESRRRVLIAFFVLAACAAAWTLGWIAPLVYFVPVLNRFRWLFKVQAFVGFFIVAVGAAGLDMAADRIQSRRRRLAFVSAAIILNVVALMHLNLLHRYRGFFEHLDPVPLTEPLAAAPLSGRFLSIGWHGGVGGQGMTTASLGFDYASLWGLHNFGGYDPLMPKANYLATLGLNYAASYRRPVESLPFSYLRQWSVRYYIVKRDKIDAYEGGLLAQGAKTWRDDPERRVYYDPGGKPLIFWSRTGDDTGIDYQFEGNRVVVMSAIGEDAPLTFSLLFSPFYEALVDGIPVGIRATQIGQMELTAPAGRHRIEIRYSDPYFALGLNLAGLGLAMLGGILVVHRALARRRSARHP